MLRVLFSVLAVVAAVLAYIFGRPELYAVAVLLLVVAVILLVMAMRKRRRASREPYVPSRREGPPEDDLESLGIMDIRPRTTPRREEEGPDEEPPSTSASASPGSTQGDGREGTPATEVAASGRARPTPASPRHDDVMTPLLTALRHAVGAHTVCLLRQVDMAPQYHIEALVSGTTEVQTRGSFRTNTPLLPATLAERPVTVRHVGDGGIAAAHLGYYHARPAVREVAFAPIPHPDEDATSYFLVADAEAAERLGPARSRQVLAQFARTVGALLTPADDEEPATADTVDAEGEADGAEGSAVRPRRDIIAEEIAKARAADVPLALALVYLNQADTVADEGEGAIAATERDLAATLHQAAASCRVERFGELTFGVFYQDATDVERWTERIQQRLDAAGGALDGGVSIGVALLKERHEDPTAFRADATEALREAYESGASIILE